MCCGLGLERSSCWCPHAYSLAPNQFIEKHLFIKSLSCCPAANETPAAPIDSCAPIYQQTTRGMWARACVRVCVCGSLIRPCSRCPESVWYSVGAQNYICWINEFSPEMEKLYNYITQENLYNFSTLKKKKKRPSVEAENKVACDSDFLANRNEVFLDCQSSCLVCGKSSF